MVEQNSRKALTREEEAEANLICIAFSLRKAKLAEETAKNNRIRLEEMISRLVPTKEVGQETKVLTNGMKIIIKRGLRYKADLNAIQEIFTNQGDLDSVPIKTKTTRELDVKGYEWYKQNHPTTYNRIAQHVTVTPSKASVTVAEVGGGGGE